MAVVVSAIGFNSFRNGNAVRNGAATSESAKGADFGSSSSPSDSQAPGSTDSGSPSSNSSGAEGTPGAQPSIEQTGQTRGQTGQTGGQTGQTGGSGFQTNTTSSAAPANPSNPGGDHPGGNNQPPAQDPYHLVWEDNFNGTSLNTDGWNYEYHDPGWVNNELQQYVDRPENVYVRNGELVIRAIKTVDADGKVHYTSGRVNTREKHDFKYGKFEIRAKVPSGKGFLPAIWMMPTDENLYGQWPKCGEMDIMEVLGNQTNKAFSTLHFGEPHTQSQGSYSLSSGDFSSQYHVFSCEWNPNEIRFYVDGNLYHKENDWFSKKTGFGEATYPAPFDQPFYLILNLAVGGDWPGNPDATTGFGDNAELHVDYVKVYQKNGYDENVTKPINTVTLRDPDSTGNYVNNGDFAAAEDLNDDVNWKFLLADSGNAAADISDCSMNITTVNAGDLDYSVQMVQGNLPMTQGYKYRLSFDAYADADRTMITDISAPDKGWKRYLSDTSVALTTSKKSYQYDFGMTDDSDADGRVEFNLGNQGSTATVHITNIRLEKIGDVPLAQKVKSVLPDGNYIYNSGFDEGDSRLGYWSIVNRCSGAKVGVMNTNNIRELEAMVPSTVTGLNQVVVKQAAVAITGGKRYVLSFDAYADGSQTIQSTLAGQTFESTLTTAKKTYSYSLTTPDGLNGAELDFLLGTPGTIHIDNVRVQEDAILVNGDFSNGLTGYDVYSYTPGDVSYGVDSLHENNAFCMDIKNTGDQDWKIQLKQNNVTLEQGKWYKITLDAKSTLNRRIMYALQRDGTNDNDWTPYSGSQKIDLTNSYQTFSTTFQMTRSTDKATILSISMGAVGGIQITQEHTVTIDNFKLEEVAAPAPPVAGNMIQNGDFSGKDQNWTNAITAPGAATVDFSQGKAVYTITNPGDQDWNVQLKQEGMTFEKGCSYKVKFKVMSDASRTVKYALLDPNAGYAWYGGADVSLTAGTEQQIEQTLTIDKDTSNAVDFVISMGKIANVDTPASVIQIRDVSIVKQ
jgi:beta-glucanase (GH16 family)